MNHLKKTLLLSVFLCFYFLGAAQQQLPLASQIDEDWIQKQINNPEFTFSEISAKADSFYMYIDTNTNMTRNEKFYEIWNYFWKSRYLDSATAQTGGSFDLFQKYHQKSLESNYSFCSGSGNYTPWSFYGPKETVYANMGRIDAVSVKPENNDVIVASSFKGGIYRTTNGGSSWSNVTDNLDVPVLAVNRIERSPFNSSVLIASTANGTSRKGHGYLYGLLVSTDDGQTWAPSDIIDDFPQNESRKDIMDISFNPNASSEIIVITKRRIYYSSDLGQTWVVTEDQNILNSSERLIDLEIVPTHINNSGDIFVSTVSGDPQTNPAQIYKIDRQDYTNGGQITFTNISPTNISVQDGSGTYHTHSLDELIKIDFSEISNNDLYALAKTKYTVGIVTIPNKVYMKYNINTSQWTYFNGRSAIPSFGLNKNDFEVSNLDEDKIYIGANELRISEDAFDSDYKSTDYCSDEASSEAEATHADIRALKLFTNSSGDECVIIGHDGGIAISEDEGDTWLNINGTGFDNSLFYSFDFVGEQILYGGLHDNSILTQSSKNSPEWFETSYSVSNLCTDGGFTRSKTSEKNVLYGYLSNDLYMSTDGGYNFSAINYNTTMNFTDKFEVNPLKPEEIYYGHDELRLLNTETSTDQVVFSLPQTYGPEHIEEIEVSPFSDDTIYFSCEDPTFNNSPLENKFYRSVDGGQNFEDITDHLLGIYTYSFVTDIEFDPNIPGDIYLTCGEYWDYPQGSEYGVNRVLYSSDGGENWIRIDDGLGPFPVNCIEIVQGGDREVYIGTDVGVFRWEASQGTWKCMWEDMPKAIVTDLRIDYCERKLYASTFGRGIWVTDLQPQTSQSAEEITTNTTLETDHYKFSLRDIIVKSGAIYTIKGKLDMDQNTKIVVENGGKLVVDGGTISNRCGLLWDGIQVYGNQSTSQFTGNPGEVLIKNSSLIEFAEEGVINTHESDLSKSGGVIKAYNSTFKDCKRAAAFYQYENYHNGDLYNDKSEFEKCEFITTDEFPLNYPIGFVSMWHTYGVNVFSCDFRDERTDPTTYTPYGIKTLDAYTVISGTCFSGGVFGTTCTQYDNCTFENLQTGVEVTDASTNNTARISRCDFTNNHVGIKVSSMDQTEVTFNNFNWDGNVPDDFTNNIGMLIENASGFLVEENEFFDDQTAHNTSAVGVISFNTGSDNNQIRRNDYEGMLIGNWAYDQNRSVGGITPPGFKGLEFLCNTYDNNNVAVGGHSHTVYGTNNNNITTGIKNTNGISAEASGNCLPDDMLSNEDFANLTANPLTYFYYDNGAVCEVPVEVTNNVNTNVGDENTCPSAFDTDPPVLVGATLSSITKNQLWSDFTDAHDVYIEKVDEFSGLIDNGNTDSLLNVLNTLDELEETEELYDDLKSVSPYLSDTVLKKWAYYHPSKLSEAQVVDLILDNIDAIHSTTFIDYLENKATPISSQNIDTIENALGLYSTARGALELEIMQYGTERSRAIHPLMRDLQHDTLHNHFDSLRSMLTYNESVFYKMDIIDNYIKEGDYSSASSALSALSTANYHDLLQDEVSDFITFKTSLLNLLSNERTVAELTSGEVENLAYFANNATGKARYQTGNILCFFYDYCLPEIFTFPFSVERKAEAENIENNTEDEAKDPTVKIYPNPANEFITVQWMTSSYQNQRIVISDISGKLILDRTLTWRLSSWQWNTTNVTPGIYVINVYDGNQLEHSEKISIVH